MKAPARPFTGLSIADADAGSGSLTVTLAVAHGTLTVAGGSASINNSGTGNVTLTGRAGDINLTLAATVIYVPAANYSGTDTLTMTSNDNGHTGTGGPKTDIDTVSITVNAQPVNIPPVITTTGAVLPYTENGVAIAIDGALTVSDADSVNLSGATVTVSSNYASGQDVLGFTSQFGITGSRNAATGVLTLTGTTTVMNYQSALRSVTYVNSSDNPGTAMRTVSFVVNDGAADSNTAARSISVAAVNDPPVVTTTGAVLPYTENGAAIAIDSALTVSDADSVNLSGATVTVSSNYASGQDVLGFTSQFGITGSWNAATGVLTLTGTTTVMNYQSALRSVTYVNSSDNPGTAMRTVSFVVNDGVADSNTAARSISVAAVNDAPTATILPGASQPCPTILSGNTIDADVSDPKDPPGSLSLLWDPGSTQIIFTSTTNPAPTVSVNPPFASSQGLVGLTVTDSGGLSVIDNKCIRVCNPGSANCP